MGGCDAARLGRSIGGGGSGFSRLLTEEEGYDDERRSRCCGDGSSGERGEGLLEYGDGRDSWWRGEGSLPLEYDDNLGSFRGETSGERLLGYDGGR